MEKAYGELVKELSVRENNHDDAVENYALQKDYSNR
jgi:hypothetical protein